MTGGDDPKPAPEPDRSADAGKKEIPGLSSTPTEESEADRKARLERQAQQKRERDAVQALERAHAYARATWTSPTDTKVVRDQYADVLLED